MVMSRNQNAGQNHNIRVDNKSFERVEQFKYLGTTLTYRNSIQEKIKSRLKSGNGCEIWSLTLRKEHRLRVFANRVLRRIFGPKRDEVAGEWRRLHNEERNDLYSSPNIILVIKSRIMRWAGHVARMGEGRGAYRILVGRSEGRRPLERPRRRREDDVKMDLQEVGWRGMDWIDMAQDRDRWPAFVKAVMNLRVP
jgi:hypothetical protein